MLARVEPESAHRRALVLMLGRALDRTAQDAGAQPDTDQQQTLARCTDWIATRPAHL